MRRAIGRAAARGRPPPIAASPLPLHRWKAFQGGAVDPPTTAPESGADAAAAGVAALAVTADTPPPDAAAPPPAPKEKKKKKGSSKDPTIVLEVTTRGKRKSVTIVSGLDAFGVKLGEAAKLMGKKFASGASVTKTAEGGEQIECQGDVMLKAADLVLATWGKEHGVEKRHFFGIVSKKKSALFPDE